MEEISIECSLEIINELVEMFERNKNFKNGHDNDDTDFLLPSVVNRRNELKEETEALELYLGMFLFF